ncbi:MAG TPA: alpha/beta fold hydrolase [Methylomirabilota bacterium]|jgi:dienelactone hydrolase
MSTISIAVDDQHINGKLLQPKDDKGRRPALLFVHGWGSSQRRSIGKAKQLVQLGFVCLTFNLRGHARTVEQRETVTRAQNLRDVIAAYDLLVAQPDVDAEQIAVVGGSYGGYLATLLTAERDVRALALRAPALYKDADFDRPKRQLNLDPDLPAYRRRHLEPSDNLVLAAAARFEGDVLIVESEHDTVIPHPVIANYLRAFGAAGSVEHEVMKDADHGLSQKGWRRAWGDVLVRWAATRLPAALGEARPARTA